VLAFGVGGSAASGVDPALCKRGAISAVGPLTLTKNGQVIGDGTPDVRCVP
jgi:hypothetical protein